MEYPDVEFVHNQVSGNTLRTRSTAARGPLAAAPAFGAIAGIGAIIPGIGPPNSISTGSLGEHQLSDLQW